MNSNFNEKVVIVTGGARGIGYVCAKELLLRGATVILVDILEEALLEASDSLKALGKGIIYHYILDITKVETIAPVITKIRKEVDEIDYLVQAAGLLRGKPALEIEIEDWDPVMNVNARGLFFVMKEVVKQSMKTNGGSIVNFSSMAGVRGMNPPMCSAHYSASKGAVVALTMQGAVEWAEYGIRVNAVAPGGVKVGGMVERPVPPETIASVPLKRLSEPEDIANVVCFLLSDLSGMITGQTLVIDGGSHIVGY